MCTVRQLLSWDTAWFGNACMRLWPLAIPYGFNLANCADDSKKIGPWRLMDTMLFMFSQGLVVWISNQNGLAAAGETFCLAVLSDNSCSALRLLLPMCIVWWLKKIWPAKGPQVMLWLTEYPNQVGFVGIPMLGPWLPRTRVGLHGNSLDGNAAWERQLSRWYAPVFWEIVMVIMMVNN